MPSVSKHWFVASLPLWAYIILFKTGGSLYYALLPPLGEQVLPVWVVGFLIGFASLLQLLLDVPAGFFLDRFGYVRLLRLTSLFLSLGGLLLLCFGLHVWTFFILIVISGFGWLFFGPGVDAYLLSTAPRALVGRFLGARLRTSSLGGVIGTLLFTVLLVLPVRIHGLAIAVLLLAATAAALFLKKEPQSVHAEIKTETHHYYVHRTFLKETVAAIRHLNPASGMLALSGFAAATFYAIVWFTLPLYVKDLVVAGPLQLGLGMFDVAVILCGGLIGRLADTRNKRLSIFLGLILFAVSSSLIGFYLNAWFLVFGFVASVGDELSSVSLWSWMNQLNRDHAHDGLVASVIGLFQDVGWAVGPVLAGCVYSRIGPSWTIMVGAGFVCVSWLVSSIVLQRGVRSIFHSPLLPSTRPHRYPHKD